MDNYLILACDIGGTKTNVGFFSSEDKAKSKPRLKESTFQTFYNARYSDLQSVIREYFSVVTLKPDMAVFAVAGPVLEARSKITNLPWIIDAVRLKDLLKTDVYLINDLEATAYGVPFLTSVEKHTLNSGLTQSDGNIAVIAPGTGLGESFLIWNGSSYHAHATEGGHCDFAPTNIPEVKLLNYLLNDFEHVSYERVCSGIGIKNIYDFLVTSGELKEPLWMREQLSSTGDQTAMIINAALDQNNSCEICKLTVRIFVSILGAEAANFALKTMAKGGIYLGGGILPRILNFLDNGQFMKSFINKGRMAELVEKIPVYVILNTQIALIGAAHYGLNMKNHLIR